MASNTEIANFLIIGAIAGSNPPYHNYVYPPNTDEYTFVASAIGTGLKMMETPQARRAMTDLALLFDGQRAGPSLFNRNRDTAASWVSWFLVKIRAEFPKVYIHEDTTNPNIIASHSRGAWRGALAEFRPRDQNLSLNARRVRDMIASQGSSQRFRTFHFIFATTIFHEVGAHLLLTFLSNGGQLTPLSIAAPGYENIEDRVGESGRWLELALFGGTSEFYRDPKMWADNSQPGIPCQIDAYGWGHEIHPNVINDACQWNFSFPFDRIGQPFNPRERSSMGRQSGQNPTDPAERQFCARATDFARAPIQHNGFWVWVRDLREVVQNRNLRLRVAAG